jgi:hypothetical protein
MQTITASLLKGIAKVRIALIVPVLLAFMCVNAQAFILSVTGSDGALVSAYRWMVEEDTTTITTPGHQVPNADPNDKSIGIDIHNSYAPVLAKGHSTTVSVNVDLPNDKPYFVTVMPDGLPPNGVPRYAMNAKTVAVGQSSVTVNVVEYPIPTAQIFLLAFVDHNPINNAKDEREEGLGGCSIYLYDFSGGQVAVDGFGNPLGTTYQTDIFGDPTLGPDGAPIVDQLGDGALTTLSQSDIDAGNNPYNLKLGEALIKYLAPGKYGVRMVPPQTDDFSKGLKWSQTATIEGTPTIDAWVQAREPVLFVEGFGIGVWHAFFGFVNYTPATAADPGPWSVKGQLVTALQGNLLNETGAPAGNNTITGSVRFNHFDRPPNVQGQWPGPIVDQCWVGLNDAILIAETELVPIPPAPEPPEGSQLPSAGLYAVPCDADGSFEFTGIPPGEYQIVTWDTPLDALFGFHTVTVPEGSANETIDTDVLLSFRWFGTLEGTVFYDTDEDGVQDDGEPGIIDQAVNLRFRDGSIYQANATGPGGLYSFSEVFPFFKWLVPEVDFAKFKATGMTTAIDYGGEITSNAWPANGNKKLQPQVADAELNVHNTPNYRTELGPVLSTGMHLFLNQTNLIDWGKVDYPDGENGGISGVIFYDTTRAEDDPKFNGGEPWQPGIPRVQVSLYRRSAEINVAPLDDFPGPGDVDTNGNGIFDRIADQDGISNGDPDKGTFTPSDVDNYPFGWSEGSTMGTEDVDNPNNGPAGTFSYGDAIEITWSDSWDDNKPSGCVQDLPFIRGAFIPECADAYGTWNQVRPGVFDGGYAFGPEIDCPEGTCADWVNPSAGDPTVGYLKPGEYIVEAIPPPNYEIVRSQDKNVDFGEIFIPSPLAPPPECVGDPYVVPAELSLFPGVEANFAGQTFNTCDRKQIKLSSKQNAAGDFFMFTEVPKAARVVGFANNDRGAEFNQASPIYGEKLGVPWIPVAFRDWTGQELFRVYADEWGNYNALLPSTYSINVPSTSGVAPNMVTMVLNDPIKPDGTVDVWHNPDYSVTPWTFNYQPGTTTYTDTPMVPVAAFTTAEVGLDTNQVNGGPVIGQAYATGAGVGSGPMVCMAALPATVTLTSLGNTEILNPDWDPTGTITGPRTIIRDYGFGGSNPNNQVTLDGVPLTISSWGNSEIQVEIPSGATTGTLMVYRGDTGIVTEIGLTLNVVDCSTTQIIHVPGNYPTIQQAIDAAVYTPDAPGALILVAPGTYNENIIMYKPVRLQGAGPGSTFINGNPTPISRLDAWHARIEPPVAQGGFNGQEFEDFLLKNPFSENEAPVIIVFGEQYFPDGDIQTPGADPFANVFNPGYRFGTADDYTDLDNPVAGVGIPGQSSIGNFTLSGSKAGGGIYAVTRARGLEIANTVITNNQGAYAGGISISVPDAGFAMFGTGDFRDHATGFQNTEVNIHHNKIHKNGGFQGAGGIAFGEDAHNYLVEKNLIVGNYSSFLGGGIAHIGLSDGGVIKDNRIMFNENFFGAILQRAGDAGGIYIGGDIAGGTGAGSVTIDGNLIQGNMAGSGSGGGIRAAAISGEDVRAIGLPDNIVAPYPDPWPLYTLTITNNMIVDNIAGLDGGGISLQDVSRAVISNNTIANNDSTSVSQRAFPAGDTTSTPNPGGIASHPHTDVLNALWAVAAIGPVPEFTGHIEPTFSDPEMVSNILWHNNSWYYLDDGSGVGALTPISADFWDVGVVNSTSFLNPQSGILSSLTDPMDTGHTYTGNIDSNPMFVSEYVNLIEATKVLDEGGNNINMRFTPLAGDPMVLISDYHIADTSPAVDTGMPNGLTQDFDDDPRPSGAGFDIGADENPAGIGVTPCPADLTGDGLINLADLIALRANYGAQCQAGQPCPGDISGDNQVNLTDLIQLRAVYGTACP